MSHSYLLFLEASLEKLARCVEAPACSGFSSEALVPGLQLRLIECSQGRLASSSSIGTGPEGCEHGNGDDSGWGVHSSSGDCSQNLPTSRAIASHHSCIRLSCSGYLSLDGRTLSVEHVSLGPSPAVW